MDTKELLQAIAERVQSSASVKTIVGEPIRAEGKTLIPFARVAYGFGAGGGHGTSGSGGGGGVRVSPIGVLEVTPDRTRFIRIGVKRRVLAAFFAGLAAAWLAARCRRR